ncbi:MAG: YqgE/AlgH family protein [Pseudomonadales bacterium]
MNSKSDSLKNTFLVSMPSYCEHPFGDSILYICHHGEYGSMALQLNTRYPMDLHAMLTHLDIPCEDSFVNQPLYRGGDKQAERGFVLHPFNACDNWLSSYQVSDELSLTSSLDILEAIASGQGPAKSVIALGYTGWKPGELEQQISDNLWLSCPANLAIIFDTAAPAKMQAAATQLGVDLDTIATVSGRA